MRSIFASVALLAAAAAYVPVSRSARAESVAATGVTLTDVRAERRVDVAVGGRPFTSYIYPTTLEKPVLYPIRSANGRLVTRGYPRDPQPGERADHPHHVGHWFNYGDVNGFDFWGHSAATPAANKPKMGTIVHTAIVNLSTGADRGTLAVRADWNIPDGSTLLREETLFGFAGGDGVRIIDRQTTWTANRTAVTFKDTKEGAFGIRVARALEHPSAQAIDLVAANGRDVERRVENAGITGQYLSSDGTTGEQVWGTRGPWMALGGRIDNAPVTLAIMDAPGNHGHPTYWHARGYGLFAANPLGRQGYDPKQDPATLTLQPGQSVTFRHRILIHDGVLTRDQLAAEYRAFVKSAQ